MRSHKLHAMSRVSHSYLAPTVMYRDIHRVVALPTHSILIANAIPVGGHGDKVVHSQKLLCSPTRFDGVRPWLRQAALRHDSADK
eukprot:scaffold333437_cov21-Prasinocladus_malaysianus.AAC.1